MPATPLTSITRQHHQRLREVYRSSGWPCHDMLEVALLANGCLERRFDSHGRVSLRVTDAGLQQLAQAHAGNRAARSAHELLVERVCLEMARAGRLVWRGLSLRAQVPVTGDAPDPLQWAMACPDVFSIRNTSVEAYLEPIVHEIKVSRADLLGDLKKPNKRAAYLGLGGECWYVLGEDAKGRPIAQPDEIPPECGVMLSVDDQGDRLVVARPAPRKPMVRMPHHIWMALARATPVACHNGAGQALL